MYNIVGQMHVQNLEQLHAYDCHQNVTEPQATKYHKRYMCTQELWVRPSYRYWGEPWANLSKPHLVLWMPSLS